MKIMKLNLLKFLKSSFLAITFVLTFFQRPGYAAQVSNLPDVRIITGIQFLLAAVWIYFVFSRYQNIQKNVASGIESPKKAVNNGFLWIVGQTIFIGVLFTATFFLETLLSIFV